MDKKYNFKEIIRKIGIDKLIIILLCGIALVVFSVPEKEKESAGISSKSKKENFVPDIQITTDEYSDKLERRLTDMLSNIKGISDVNVMITLECGNEAVVLTEASSKTSERNDSNDKGEVSVSKEYDNESVVVYEKNSKGDTIPYVVKENVPKIEGVAIIAKGADKTENIVKITSIVQALFDVEVHKISVVGM